MNAIRAMPGWRFLFWRSCMKNNEQPGHATVEGGARHGAAIRYAKWIVIVLVLLFLVTRVIRFFLQ
jgi:hypothetical protein